MAFQIIQQTLPCGAPANIRTLTGNIQVGQDINAGDVPNGTSIVEGARYIVSGTGTIDYNSRTYNVGQSFVGVSGQASFTRSANTAQLLRVQGSANPSIEDAYYAVSGNAATDSVSYPTEDGAISSNAVVYFPGDVFRGSTGFGFSEDKYSIIADGTDILAGVVYVVTGTGTITYPTAAQASSIEGVQATVYNPGDKFLGVSGGTDFTRSAATAILNRLDNSLMSSEITNNANIFKIEDTNRLSILTQHRLGAVSVPGVDGLDYGSALGINPNAEEGFVIPDPNGTLNRVYIWNFGTASATLYFRSFIPTIDVQLKAVRSDIRQVIAGVDDPAKAQAWCWLPTELFRQGANNSRFSNSSSTLSAYVIQSENANLWIKAESTTFEGVQ